MYYLALQMRLNKRCELFQNKFNLPFQLVFGFTRTNFDATGVSSENIKLTVSLKTFCNVLRPNCLQVRCNMFTVKLFLSFVEYKNSNKNVFNIKKHPSENKC